MASCNLSACSAFSSHAFTAVNPAVYACLRKEDIQEYLQQEHMPARFRTSEQFSFSVLCGGDAARLKICRDFVFGEVCAKKSGIKKYDQLDEYLDQYDGQHGYELVKKMISERSNTDVGLECRLAHACYILSNYCISKEDERCHLLEEAYTACKMAYEIEPKNAEVLKWSAIITGTLAELNTLSNDERVAYVREFKKFLDEAMASSPDSSVYHMNGRFHYRMATLSDEEKAQTMTAFGVLPAATIDEALVNLHKAEQLNPGHLDNLMFLAKCYIAKGNDAEAQKFLVPILEMTPADELDDVQIAEAQQLLAGITERNAEEPGEKDDSAENLVHVDMDSKETQDTIGKIMNSSDSEQETDLSTPSS